MAQEQTVTIRIRKSTKTRFDALFVGRDTSDGVLNKLIDESWDAPKAQRLLNEAIAKNEEAKQTGLSKLAVQAADMAIAALTEFLRAIEDRR